MLDGGRVVVMEEEVQGGVFRKLEGGADSQGEEGEEEKEEEEGGHGMICMCNIF